VRELLDARVTEIDAAVADLLALREALAETRRTADDCDDESAAVCSIIEDR
jgi:MerR family copper efflux transcriptional regulator